VTAILNTSGEYYENNVTARIRLYSAVVVEITDYYHCVKDGWWLRSITIRIPGHVYITHNSKQRIREF
jgi:hypothetical protein